MRPSVFAAFRSFTEPLEGVVPYMYRDVKDLVTCGMGNLIDPVGMAVGLKWAGESYANGGNAASVDEIKREWNLIKTAPDLGKLGWMAARDLVRPWGGKALTLENKSINELVEGRLSQNDRILEARFGNYDAMPADAQLFLHSMAWACGPAFKYPILEGLLLKGDYRACVNECGINPNVGTIVKRNIANRQLLQNAAWVVDGKGDPDVLHWPNPPQDVYSLSCTLGVQRALVQLGRSLSIDGVMGVKTRNAIKLFQSTHGLLVDGVPGPETIAALRRELLK